MTVQVERGSDGKLLLRVGSPDNHTCAEIPYHEVPKVIRALFFWLAFSDNRAAKGLLKRFDSAFDDTDHDEHND